MRIIDSLETVIRLIPEIQSILIVDRDGVPVAGAGEEARNRSQLTSAYATALEQANRLNIGEQESWVFQYEASQLVVLHSNPFAIFILATPNANTGLLRQLKDRLQPILKECQETINEAQAPQAC
ncbi:unnamed protein product [Bursaphelenchus xylophilus]|uniref:(pine wood nematode) hypothetical protein n=1 Tax=Bursaphelenchus xylophilus TaxID=6326 RepID=A0A1I7SH42_BURXY|nr:unnamed protein product [Bursaphelenchus xylophilus]CAG9122127.1 unnamed protein product [Bursaphelenchus xylophilus]